MRKGPNGRALRFQTSLAEIMPDTSQAMGQPMGSETDATQPETHRARPATTASMQNLLAEYFETKHFTAPVAEAHIDSPAFESGHFEAARMHALSAPQSETRATTTQPESTRTPTAAFSLKVAAPAVPLASEPALDTTADAIPDSQDWSTSARDLIDSLMIENEKLREQLHAQSLELREAQDMADADVLTPTLNRRAFLREVGRAMADCRRYGEEACLVYVDMDGFKSINDTYGHGAGDAALTHVAELLKASTREGDAIGRMGGDEFAVLLRRADLKSSRIKAMKLEAELALGTFEYNGLYLKCGGSFGVRAFTGQATPEAWLSEADAAMFLVKKAVR
jgi:diguanylate cyclase (GGDEF)-like protein